MNKDKARLLSEYSAALIEFQEAIVIIARARSIYDYQEADEQLERATARLNNAQKELKDMSNT